MFYSLFVQGGEATPVRLEWELHVGCWTHRFITRDGAVTCWIQQPVSPKQVVGISCEFHSEVDQLMSKVKVPDRLLLGGNVGPQSVGQVS